MRYVIYPDVIFGVEVLINYILIGFVGKIIKTKSTSLKKIYSAALGAIISTLCYVYVRNIAAILIIKYLLENSIMVFISFSIKDEKGFFKAVFIGAALDLFISGCMNYMYYNTYIGIMAGGFIDEVINPNKSMLKFIGISLITYVFLDGATEIILKQSSKKILGTYYVKIIYGEYELKIKGIYDSGNTLTEPIGKKDVYIVENSVANEICKWEGIYNSLIIVPYNCINGNGVLPTFLVDNLKVYDEFNNLIKEIESPRIGISNGNVSENGDFQMILNRGLFNK